MSAKPTFRTVDGILEKLCGGCGEFRPHDTTHFHRHKRHASGLNSHCKTCQRATCKRLTIERYALKTQQGAAQLLTQLWRTGKRPKIA